jgi:hypothetical protein
MENLKSLIKAMGGSPENLEERLEMLINFLNENSDNDEKISAGDLLGYICGYMDVSASPEDEIDIF